MIYLTAAEYRRLPFYFSTSKASEGEHFITEAVDHRRDDLCDGFKVWILTVDRTNYINCVNYNQGCIQNKGDDRVLI